MAKKIKWEITSDPVSVFDFATIFPWWESIGNFVGKPRQIGSDKTLFSNLFSPPTTTITRISPARFAPKLPMSTSAESLIAFKHSTNLQDVAK